MNLGQLKEKALEVRGKYEELEKERYGRQWTRAEIVQGFVGDVGDLMKLAMAKEGIRGIKDVDAKLEHELADCLWSVLVIANQYDIDLETAFLRTMEELKEGIDAKMAS